MVEYRKVESVREGSGFGIILESKKEIDAIKSDLRFTIEGAAFDDELEGNIKQMLLEKDGLGEEITVEQIAANYPEEKFITGYYVFADGIVYSYLDEEVKPLGKGTLDYIKLLMDNHEEKRRLDEEREKEMRGRHAEARAEIKEAAAKFKDSPLSTLFGNTKLESKRSLILEEFLAKHEYDFNRDDIIKMKAYLDMPELME